ncbi:MAG TPA: roadblock/LC7 domain-containing protein [Polyangiaceae bacterium]|nr:roadblock/LC7 domain-containing protein [Polyangiaceae bacterium]
MEVTETLASLRDVDDVRGSFLLSAQGRLVARDLPSMFHSEIFSEIGPRLVRLRETLETDGDDLSALTLRFSEHKLHLRTVGELLLGVVTSAKVNGPALRMAINLVARRVASQGSDLRPEPETAPKAETPPPPSAGPAHSERGDIVFRGRRF